MFYLPQPLRKATEGFLTGYVIGEDQGIGASVITLGDGPKSLLTCCVPDRSVQRQGRGLGRRVGKEQAADTPFPPASPFHLEGVEGLGRNYLVAKMKTSRGLSLTRDSIIGTEGCKETLAFSPL